MHRIFPLLLAGLLAACAGPMATRTGNAPVEVGIIAFNDFHGALEPPRSAVLAPDGKGGTVAVPAGGAAWLASAVDELRGKYANHLTVSAGDLISASQLPSSIHLDEPAIGVANRIGLDFNAVGNHEFDRGRQELLRMQRGGCEKHTAREPCALEPFAGARFAFLAASTLTEDGGTLFPATALRRFGEGRRAVTVGLIGLTLEGTPQLVSPAGIEGLTFADEAETINALVPRLKDRGADAVVVLIHQGGNPSGAPDPDGCEGLAGEIAPILERLDPRVDLVVSGHTHQAYVCDYPSADPGKPFLLTSAGVYGRLVTDIALHIDPAAGRVVAKRARNVIVQSEPFTSAKGAVPLADLFPRFEPRSDVAAYVGRYVEAAREFSQRPIGWLAGPASRPEGAEANTGGPLGNLIADSQRGATEDYGAQVAFMNPFGIRAALVPAADGTLTFGDIYQAQPFGNNVVTLTLTGAELKATLEQGLDDEGPEQVPTPSAGFDYRFDRSRPAGDRIVSMTLAGAPLRPDADYRITVNGFLALGGDGFTGFAAGRDRVTGPTDIEALEAWLKAEPARAVPQEVRAGPE